MYAANFRQTLSKMDIVVAEAGDGWLLGSGSWYDPCVDRLGIFNTLVAFVVFFLLMCVVVFDYFLQRRTSGECHWILSAVGCNEPVEWHECDTMDIT